jgi:voltage-dependent potassium channel beta subunit
MYYRTLGNTGMVTSVFGFGFFGTFGVKEGLTKRQGIEEAKKILTVARQGGINLFDNAETYGNPTGEAERIFGQAYCELQQEDPVLWRRSDVLITTKLFWGGSGLNEKGLSRKHLVEGMEASLKRLQLPYVDLIYCHRPDSLTPTESIVRSMTQLIRDSKAMAWGTSEWSAQQITEAAWIAKTQGLEPPQFEQPEYNVFERERVEREYYPLYQQPYNIGLTIWGPLASGLLTGKYNHGALPEGSRATEKGYEWLQGRIAAWTKEGKIAKVEQLEEYAKTNFPNDVSVADLALAWCVKNQSVTCVLLGASKVEQMEANLKAIDLIEQLTDRHVAELEEILQTKPANYWGHGDRKIPTI